MGTSRFPLGRIVATPGALQAIEAAGDSASNYIKRYGMADWGDGNAEDSAANERALESASRLFSAYRLSSGEKIWIITETDRRSTCLLLPNEY